MCILSVVFGGCHLAVHWCLTFVILWIDICNNYLLWSFNVLAIVSVLAGLPASSVRPLQRVQNAAARLVLTWVVIARLSGLCTAAGHRLYGDVVSEEDDAANYSQHLRELQNYITQPQSATNQLSFSTNALSVPEKTAQRVRYFENQIFFSAVITV